MIIRNAVLSAFILTSTVYAASALPTVKVTVEPSWADNAVDRHRLRSAMKQSLPQKDFRDALAQADVMTVKKILVGNGLDPSLSIAIPSRTYLTSDGTTIENFTDNDDTCLEWKLFTYSTDIPPPTHQYTELECVRRGHTKNGVLVLTYYPPQ